MLHQRILTCPLHTEEKDGEGLQLLISSQSCAGKLPSSTALKPGMPPAGSDRHCASPVTNPERGAGAERR